MYWESDEEEEDHFADLSVAEVKEFHGDHAHCAFCHRSKCEENAVCAVVACPDCRVRLHECKLIDHLELCPAVFVACINASFGCPDVIRRDRRGQHLAHCCASVVSCCLQWNRRVLGKQAKRRMKQVARGFKSKMVEEEVHSVHGDEFDVCYAMMDQELIMDSYRCPRALRVKQRQPCTPVNPILPLRIQEQGEFDEADSSDEEQFKEEQERRKMKKAFADCYICKLEPGIQHLHVLGNLNNKEATNAPENELNPDNYLHLFVPEFYRKRNLFLRLSELRFMDSHRKAFQYDYARELHTMVCCQFYRRDEVALHWLYHTEVLQELDGFHVSRCPGAMRGCDFLVHKKMPAGGGRMRFDQEMKLFLWEPMSEISSANLRASSELGDFKRPFAVQLLLQYLDPLSLRTLSAVNSTFCGLVRGFGRPRTRLSFSWKRDENRKWQIASLNRSFSALPDVPKFAFPREPVLALFKHIGKCSFCVPVQHQPELAAKLQKVVMDGAGSSYRERKTLLNDR